MFRALVICVIFSYSYFFTQLFLDETFHPLEKAQIFSLDSQLLSYTSDVLALIISAC